MTEWLAFAERHPIMATLWLLMVCTAFALGLEGLGRSR